MFWGWPKEMSLEEVEELTINKNLTFPDSTRNVVGVVCSYYVSGYNVTTIQLSHWTLAFLIAVYRVEASPTRLSSVTVVKIISYA